MGTINSNEEKKSLVLEAIDHSPGIYKKILIEQLNGMVSKNKINRFLGELESDKKIRWYMEDGKKKFTLTDLTTSECLEKNIESRLVELENMILKIRKTTPKEYKVKKRLAEELENLISIIRSIPRYGIIHGYNIELIINKLSKNLSSYKYNLRDNEYDFLDVTTKKINILITYLYNLHNKSDRLIEKQKSNKLTKEQIHLEEKTKFLYYDLIEISMALQNESKKIKSMVNNIHKRHIQGSKK